MRDNEEKIQEIPEFKIPEDHNASYDEDLIEVDLENYEFSCIRCGKCCRTVLSELQSIGPTNWYQFDYHGRLVKNATISVNVFPFEKEILTQYPENILPTLAVFVKKKPVAFCLFYQVKVNDRGHCIFYSDKIKRCTIYTIRPIACRLFPLKEGRAALLSPFDHGCTSFRNEVKKQNKLPYISEHAPIKVRNLDTGNIFKSKEEFGHNAAINKLYSDLVEPFNKQFSFLFHDITSSAFKKEYNKLKPYTILNFLEFPEWARRNLKSDVAPDELEALVKNISERMEEILYYFFLDDDAKKKLWSK